MKYVVKWIVYTQFCGIDYFGADDSLEEDEEIEEEYDTYEQALTEVRKNKYGHCGQFVAVYVDDDLVREYEV